jgi:hypothetical protein
MPRAETPTMLVPQCGRNRRREGYRFVQPEHCQADGSINVIRTGWAARGRRRRANKFRLTARTFKLNVDSRCAVLRPERDAVIMRSQAGDVVVIGSAIPVRCWQRITQALCQTKRRI